MTAPASPVPVGAWAVDRPRSTGWSRVLRVVVALALLAVGVGLIVWQQEVRIVEAAAARLPLAVLLGQAVHVPGTDLVFYPDYAGPGLRALKVTFSCSSVPKRREIGDVAVGEV